MAILNNQRVNWCFNRPFHIDMSDYLRQYIKSDPPMDGLGH